MGETVANVHADWSGGDLVYKNSSGTAVLTIQNNRANEYDEYSLYGWIASAENSGQIYIPIPHSGTVVNLQVVPEVAATGEVGFTAFVSTTSAITHAALTIASGATAGTVTSIAPTAEGAVDEDEAVLFRSNGNHTGSLPVSVVLTVRRT